MRSLLKNPVGIYKVFIDTYSIKNLKCKSPEAETNLTAPRIAGKPMKSPHSEARYREARWEYREGVEDQVPETGRSQIR